MTGRAKADAAAASPPEPANPLRFWNELTVTDPAFTKPFKKGGGFTGTDINPTWRMKRMTEVFGPVGQGWGWTLSERWSEDVTTKPRDQPERTVKYAYVMLSVWYEADGKRFHTGQHIGGTEMGMQADEAYKMAVTDALGKCMTALGLAADIYMGQFDDSKYREFAAQHHDGKAAAAVANEGKALLDQMRAELAGLALAEDVQSLWETNRLAIQRVKASNAGLYAQIVDAFKSRKETLAKPADPASA